MTAPRILQAILGLVTVGLCTLKTEAQTPTVDLTMVAPWAVPNFLVEVAETVATQNETAYFSFIHDFIALEKKSSSWTPSQLYSEVVSVISFLGNDNTNFFKAALAIHEAAPRIESYHQYYRESVTPTLSQYDDQCGTWIQIGKQQFCSIESFKEYKGSYLPIEVLAFDHVVRPKNELKKVPVLVLYTDRFSAEFSDFYRHLTTSPLYLSAYGVELALKKTDYLVIDDRSSEAASKDSIKEKLSKMGRKIGQSLFHTNQKAKIDPLTPAEIQKLGLKAAQYVAKSTNPLETLTQLSQDFPKYAKSVSEVELDVAFEKEVIENQHSLLRAGLNAIWLNGKGLEYSQINPFYLIRALRSERKLIKSFERLGLTPKQAIQVISNPALTAADRASSEGNSEIYDVRDTPENPFIVWWNDIEKDKKYSGWTDDMEEYLRPSYPGQLHPVKKNIFNLIMVEDLANIDALARIVNEIQMMIRRLVPIRFGIVPFVKQDDNMSTIMAQALNYIIQEHGKGDGMNFLTQALETLRLEGKRHPSLSDIQQSFEKTIAKANNSKSKKSFREALETQQRMSIQQVGIDNNVMFMNGKLIEFTEERANQKEAHIANLWIFANLNTISGLKLASEALSFTESNSKIRIALIHSSTTETQSKDYITIPVTDDNTKPLFSDVLGNLIFNGDGMSVTQAKEIIDLAIKNHLEQAKEDLDNSKVEAIFPGSPIIDMEAKAISEKWSLLNNHLEKHGLERGFFGIVLNGRIVGPFDGDVEFSKENFGALFNLEHTKRIAPIEQSIRESGYINTDHHPIADILAKATALIETDKANTAKGATEDNEPVYRHRVYNLISSTQHTRIVVGDLDNSFLEIGVIIDPLSEDTQKWAPILQTLSEIEGISVVIHLNPISQLDELPIRRFYRYVFDKEPHFDSNTGQKTIPTAYFADLPIDPLYTLGVETNNAWHVTVREANMDLDNILLSSLKEGTSGVSAVYELESILLEGHCIDSNSKSAPRGLEFEISTPSGSSKKDTLVMANLGYFQLKALPGVWKLGLREGRSSVIYSVEDIGTEGKWNWDAVEKKTDTLALTSFEGLTVMPLVHKNPGMEMEDVLGSSTNIKKQKDDKSSGLWSSLSEKLFGKKQDDQEKENNAAIKPKQADINIFSVASGKLYERFLSIMMVSVMKHTDSTVKFWFIENFLSPEFKNFVPYMAKEYGFEYEMITYKWPSWLRAQQEKQRTIWGYKILFLDVLFPLSLDKVIFVDADQIVRTDLKELIDMDLQGAPYGYTPFCSDRTEMDGFRFWTEGYWKNHLRGRPYHISALYVVDLVRFRQLAAGDRLRAQYQQLSADPNSLANLDQDLPNNMQHAVPIFSLPQEWLWCETWCSDESLKKAKTIDLCNNPLTKEPKLDRARRQVPEWEAYDNEIDKLRQKTATEAMHKEKHGDQIVISAGKDQHVKDEL
ncbi:hypothetical protein CU098_007561 [Rhizopus stolonifer]|uniref:UDP-glucose glycoprotein glucosyltransferase n=1 Tax=Rhizopus stolonifer TaxID=4846 RepID=A0A367KNS1_RHIST|nr:hypothetical protein CU098_007561 [Rhizopus stolonifer]